VERQNGGGFRWRDADAYLFDIDGTLMLCPDRTHRYALHRALLEVYGVETTIDGIPYHGKTDPGILRAALERAGIANEVIDRQMPAALEVVRQDASEKADRFRPNVLPGIRDVLNTLRGWKTPGNLLGEPGSRGLAQTEGGRAGGLLRVRLLCRRVRVAGRSFPERYLRGGTTAGRRRDGLFCG